VRIEGREGAGGGLCLAVEDGGPGIPAEFAQRVFDRFAQVPDAETGAAGLGLSLAAEIAAVHGGRLALANPGCAGARFECCLPASGADRNQG
jgi:signal transduction histidine kinase